MSKIYVITAGEYSDYCIIAVFDNKKLAEKFGGNIEVYELNAGYNRRGFVYRVIMDRTGGSDISLFLGNFKRGDLSKPRAMFNGKISILVRAKSGNHAAKIANEKRVQLIANNKWPIFERGY